METGTRSFGSWRSFPEPSRQFRGWREEGPRGARAFIGIVIHLLLLVAVVHWLDLLYSLLHFCLVLVMLPLGWDTRRKSICKTVPVRRK